MKDVYSYPTREIEKKERCLVLLSGGLDSVTATYWAKKQGYSVEALFFDSGHAARDKELECVMDVVDRLEIRLHVFKIPLSQKILQDLVPLANLSLRGVNGILDMSVFNGIIISLAIGTSYALTSRIGTLIVGISADNVKMHPGLRPEFFRAFEKLITLWTSKEVKILTPFLKQNKSAIIGVGTELGVLFQHTWSCSTNNKKHCGRCIDCLARAKAFLKIGFKDPTEYETYHFNLFS